MSKKEKLIDRLLSEPRDFTFDETVTVLRHFGFRMDNAGKTSGSRVIFRHDFLSPIEIHRPHPDNHIKLYSLRQIIQQLREGGLI